MDIPGGSHLARVRRDLDFLVAHGVLETRVRSDGEVGYWPTALAFTVAEAEAARRAHHSPIQGEALPRLCAVHRCRHQSSASGEGA
jgi:hypothetical protein